MNSPPIPSTCRSWASFPFPLLAYLSVAAFPISLQAPHTHLLCAWAALELGDGLAVVVVGRRSWHPGADQRVCHVSIRLSLCQPPPCQPQDLLSHTFPLWRAGLFPKPVAFTHFLCPTSGEQFGKPKPGAEAKTISTKGWFLHRTHKFGKTIIFKQLQLSDADGGQAADLAATHLIAYLGGWGGGWQAIQKTGSGAQSQGDGPPRGKARSQLPSSASSLLQQPIFWAAPPAPCLKQEPFGSPKMELRVTARGAGCQGRERRGQREKQEVEACAGRHRDLAPVLPATCQRFKLHKQAPATRRRLMTYGFHTFTK